MMPGEKKVMPNGALCGVREYRCRTFMLPSRGEKLFMLSTECAEVLGYMYDFVLFDTSRTLHQVITSETEKDDLVSREILPPSYRSKYVAVVNARSIFRQFGSRVVVNGRRVRDDYWETRAREKGFAEADSAGPTRPGAGKAREEATSAISDEHMEHSLPLLSESDGGSGVPSAFELYRNNCEAEIIAKNPGLGTFEMSKVFIELCLEEKQEVKNHWIHRAEASHNLSTATPPGKKTSQNGGRQC